MKFDDFVIGYKGSLTRQVTIEYNNQFAEISGDFNPIHFDDTVGKKFGFKSAISNGFVTESRIAGALVETFGSEETVVVALEKNTRFLAPVYMGDVITATVEVVGRLRSMKALKIKAKCFNQNNVQVADTNMVIKILVNN
ncbi:MAG: hypothetical protein HQ504_02795 [Rhodospirillaceae bacterium]|nr:hypothetical protein [Rhodospirillaceae bacterium]